MSLHSRWCNMHARCYDTGRADYHRYGGRGITICERWHLFVNFRDDMGEPPPGKSLDRINNDGNYCPENCRWATHSEQMLNRAPYKHRGKMKARTLRTHCPRNHEFTTTNTYTSPKTGHRQCRECKRINWRNHYDRQNYTSI